MKIKDIFKRSINNIGGDNAALRDQWVGSKLKKMKPGLKILDVGAGEGRYKKYTNHLKYVAQDFNGYDGEGDGVGLHTGVWDYSNVNIVSDITDMPVPNEEFDIVLCTEVLEHVPDPRGAVKEIVRVLKSGGKLIMTAPFCSLTHFAPYHYSTGFNKYFYIDLFEDGFLIDELAPSGDWFDYISQELRRLPAMINDYTNGSISIVDKLLISFALMRMNSYKEKQKEASSSELLTYGYHMLATKK